MQISLCKQKILEFLLELSSQTYLSFWFTLQVKMIIHIFITKMHRCASMLALSSRNFQQIWPQKNIAVFQSWKKITSFPFFMPFAHFFLVALDWSEFPNHVCCAEHKSSFGFFFSGLQRPHRNDSGRVLERMIDRQTTDAETAGCAGLNNSFTGGDGR